MAFTFDINGHTYTSDPTNTGVPAAYHFDGYNYLTALGNLAVDIVAVAAQVLSNKNATDASAAAAAASAASAAAIAGSFVGTSSTSLLIGMGSKIFTTQAGEQYTGGIFMTAVSAANPDNYMAGQVEYSGTTLTMDVVAIGGEGTHADWNLSIAGVPGPAGPDSLPTAAAGGTVDAITATFSPAITLTDRQKCCVICAGANTSATPTFAPDGLAAHTITTNGGQALAAGSIPAAGFVAILEYNAAGTRWELMNPASTESQYKYVTASDAIGAGVMAEYDSSGTVMPWNNVLATSIGQAQSFSDGATLANNLRASCVLADGRILVAGVDGSNYPAVQVYTKYGIYSSAFVIESVVASTNAGSLSIAATSNGGFVVAWNRQSDGYPMYRGYDASLSALYAAAAEYAIGGMRGSSVVDIPGLSQFAVFRRTGGPDFKVAKYNYSGVLQGSVIDLFTESTDGEISAALLSSGEIVLAYLAATTYYPTFRRYSTSFALQGSATAIYSGSACQYACIAVSAGKFAVFFRGTYNTGVNSRVLGAVYNDNGTVSTAAADLTGTTTVSSAVGAAWNGTNYGVAYFGGGSNYVAMMTRSSTLASVGTTNTSNAGSGAVTMSATVRKDFFGSFGATSQPRDYLFAGQTTNLAGVCESAVALGGSAKLKTKGLASLTAKATANVDFNHSAKTPAGVKGSIYNYAAILTN